MTDTMETFRQNVEQEAADEFIRAERHGALAVDTIVTIVLVAEGNAGLVKRDQAAVRNGDAVGVPRQVGEHRLRSGEGRLGVHDPPLLAKWYQVTKEGATVT